VSARSHHRVRPTPLEGPRPRVLSSSPYTAGRPTVCDSCGTSMTGQEFRGDKCLDCRVRDGEAEVDEAGEELIEGDDL
jgi:tRNA(Ile2) C34 agmatinyltransferase TiaS